MTKIIFPSIEEAKQFSDQYWSKFTMSDPSINSQDEGYITFCSYSVNELIEAANSSNGTLSF